ncbi:uncharacterized protein [Narcine bancroftii]|uniref:uncharacterized protein n=1 Tax=Narcine bancroftii TaxID=1343680 RepID=UPI0038321129
MTATTCRARDVTKSEDLSWGLHVDAITKARQLLYFVRRFGTSPKTLKNFYRGEHSCRLHHSLVRRRQCLGQLQRVVKSACCALFTLLPSGEKVPNPEDEHPAARGRLLPFHREILQSRTSSIVTTREVTFSTLQWREPYTSDVILEYCWISFSMKEASVKEGERLGGEGGGISLPAVSVNALLQWSPSEGSEKERGPQELRGDSLKNSIMARRVLVLISVLYFTLFTHKRHASARSQSYLSCTYYYSGDDVLLDCFYRGGVPFPTLIWTGPGGFHQEMKSTRRLIVNMTQHKFVNNWDTIYKCKANYRYTSSYCYVGRGIGNYVGIAFGVLGLLFLMCIFVICLCKACEKLAEKYRRWRGRDMSTPTGTSMGFNNPTFKQDPGQEGKTPE